ncbi:MAG: PAS domain S-box protein [Chitinispirillales bacterium]|jgi:PAS domain S-box-containing protein|nr:PAS domain S-box protein [Chitinispirillales bacterium]
MSAEYFNNGVDSDAGVGVDADSVFSEMRRLTAENSHLQEYLDRIAGITSAIIYILDANGRFIFVNRGVEDILNFSPEELIGKHFSFILPPEEYERVSREAVLPRIAGRVIGSDSAPKLFDERRRGPRRTRNMEVRLMMRCPDDYRVMAGSITGVVEVEGAYSLGENMASGGSKETFLGSQGVIFDITKYKEAELDRLDLHKRLFQIQKTDAIGKLSGKIAHDLNNKLGSIIGTAEIMKQCLHTTDPQTLSMYIDTILSASKHAADLSNRLSEFSRKGESPFERLDFHNLLDRVMEYAETIGNGNVSIHKILLSKQPIIIGSETILQNAMLNLVMNAFEAMNGNGGALTIETNDVTIKTPTKTVFLSLLVPGDYLLVSVGDTGVGMDDEVKKRLFEPFFTTHSEKGFGLGLVSIRECIRNHGGIINMESDVGKGSRFDIYFPKPS